ncbi:Uncharacterised protein [Candidatus Burarchaeum australiense]|nr:Uncharacterised protein [Candidatus Burarchaeum australiense]
MTAVAASRVFVPNRSMVRTDPPLSTQPLSMMPERRRNGGNILHVLVHPYYSTRLGWGNESLRFPRKLSSTEKSLYREKQEGMMTEIWKAAIASAAKDQSNFLLFVPAWNSEPCEGLLAFARRRFGKRMLTAHNGYSWSEIADKGRELAASLKDNDIGLRLFGEYTKICVAELAVELAYAVRGIVAGRGSSDAVSFENVIVLRRMSVDSVMCDYGDPFSPPENMRMMLLPKKRRAAAFEREKKRFEDTFTENVRHQIHEKEILAPPSTYS